MITEWLRSSEQADAIDALFKPPNYYSKSVRDTEEVRGNDNLRAEWTPMYAADEVMNE